MANKSTNFPAPPKLYEEYRRRTVRDVQEFWFFLRSQLENLSRERENLNKKILEILTEAETRYDILLLDLENLAENDGHDVTRKISAVLKYIMVLIACVIIVVYLRKMKRSVN